MIDDAARPAGRTGTPGPTRAPLPAAALLLVLVVLLASSVPAQADARTIVDAGRPVAGWVEGDATFLQARKVLVGARADGAWRDAPGELVLAPGATLLADRALGSGDGAVRARLRWRGEARGASNLRVGDASFGWDGAAGRPFVEGGPFGATRLLDAPGGEPPRERWFDLAVARRDGRLSVAIDGVVLHEVAWDGPLGRVTLRAHRAELHVAELRVEGTLSPVRAPHVERLRVPTLDATLPGAFDVMTADAAPGGPAPDDGASGDAASGDGGDGGAEVPAEPVVLSAGTLLQGQPVALEVRGDPDGAWRLVVRRQVLEEAREDEIPIPAELPLGRPGSLALVHAATNRHGRAAAPPVDLVAFLSDASGATNGLLATSTWGGRDQGVVWSVRELPASLAGAAIAAAGDAWDESTCCDLLPLVLVDGLEASRTRGDLLLALADADALAAGGDVLARVRLVESARLAPDGRAARLAERAGEAGVARAAGGRLPACADCLVDVTLALADAATGTARDVTLSIPFREVLDRADAYDATLPLVDLAHDEACRVVVDREPGQYLGHPTTVLLPDGRTMYCTYPKGHGRGAIVMKRSDDGGLTWSGRLPLPASFATSQEVPTIHRLVDREGVARLVLFSGLFPVRRALSLDEGRTWSELEPVGAWGGIVTMASVVPLRDGRHLAVFHDDGRFLTADGGPPGFTVHASTSDDGGVTWSAPRPILHDADAHLCEPGLVRSPDGARLAMLLRENSRAFHAFVSFSDDEGATWTLPRELPASLTGDRHVGAHAPDGRLVVSFRDTLPGSPTQGDWLAWVGTFDDLVRGTAGEYRVRLGDNLVSADCAYPGVEVLPDGTFVVTTYGHWTAGEEPYVVSVRFALDTLDARVPRAGPR